MRFRLRPLTVLVFSIPTALMGVLAACGGDSATTDGGADATVDVAKDVAPDTYKADVAVVDAGCDAPDLSSLLPGDGGIDVDAGGFSFGPCLTCLEAPADAGGCGSQVQACNADCWCRQGIIDFGTCVAQDPQQVQNCALTAIASQNPNISALLFCAQQQCMSACAGGVDGGAGDGGGDSGPTDAGGGG